MRFHFLHSSAKSSLAGVPNTAISLAAHLLLIGAAVRGTGTSADELRQEIAQRVAFLPPPDRRPPVDASKERLYFVDVGAGAGQPTTDGLVGEAASQPRPSTALPGGAQSGRDQQSAGAEAEVSYDSVYSVLQVEESVMRTERSAAPAYPEDLRKESREGRVLVRYVVDTTGRVDSSSIQVIGASHEAFARSVREALPQMRFTAASIGGKHVRQLVEQPFDFRMTPAVQAEHTRAAPEE
ncbi:MAG: energy transducer TonB [Gemmatimonadaceae bacterium]|nr:energy transducer TonB [Gemmatimonadaceae bacterium]